MPADVVHQRAHAAGTTRRRARLARVARLPVALAVLVGGLVLAPQIAHADAGLEFVTDATYVLRPQSSVVAVTESITVTNVKPDQPQGNSVRRFYYDAITVPIPTEAANVVASSNGSDLALTPGDAGTTAVAPTRIAFANLYFGQQRTVQLSYELPGNPPRTKDVARVNSAYAAFVAYGVGDPGRVSVHVIVPRAFDVETFGAEVTPRTDGDTLVYEATDIGSPDDWYLLVSARLDGALTRSDVDIDDRKVSVRGWPNDPEWSAFVDAQLRDGLPALQKLIGQPWPLTDRLEIVEAFTPYLRGYGGWFQPLDNRIEVGETLDRRLLLHELAHAWFNRSFATSRWISEGMAEEYSARTVAALGGTLDTPKAIDAANPNAVKLEHWTVPAKRNGAGDVEDFGYNAAWYTIRQLTDEIGMDKMAAVDAAGFGHKVAYPGADAGETTPGATDWRRFLDLLESVGGSAKATKLFDDAVLNDTETAELPARATARSAYASLVAAGTGWFVPAGARDRMEHWDFTAAGGLMAKAGGVLTARDTLQAAAGAAGLAVPSGARAAYEAASTIDDLAAVTADEQRRLDAVAAIVAARAVAAAPRNRAVRLGFWHRDPPEPLLDAAVQALAADDTVTATADAARASLMVKDAAALGRRRVRTGTFAGGGLLAALVLLTVVLVAAHRRRGRRPAVPPVPVPGWASGSQPLAVGSSPAAPAPAPVDVAPAFLPPPAAPLPPPTSPTPPTPPTPLAPPLAPPTSRSDG